jgi:hypothetical protein
MRDKFKMARVDTTTHTAQMVTEKTVRDWPILPFMNQTMYDTVGTMNPYSGIAIGVE